MDVASAFDDPRHRRSEELVFRADRKARSGDLDGARSLYLEAAEPELEVARDLTEAEPRGVFAISGVTSYVRARKWDRAVRAAHEFLAHPELLTERAQTELESLLDDALRTRELYATLGDGIDAAPLEIRLEGGRVRRGLCPSAVVQEREEIAEALVYRVAEFLSGRRFRKAGPSAFSRHFGLYEAPARAASYGIRFVVVSHGQKLMPGVDPSPRETIDMLLQIASVAATDGPDGIKTKLSEVAAASAVGTSKSSAERYRHAFIRALRDLAPDGTAVASVSFGSPASLYRSHVARFSPQVRASLSGALVSHAADGAFQVEGVLKSVNLRTRQIQVGMDDGSFYPIKLRGRDHDDTIGPKLNRRVQVTGTRREKDGSQISLAEDVVLIGEDEPPDALS
jgi:hypothetical protein